MRIGDRPRRAISWSGDLRDLRDLRHAELPLDLAAGGWTASRRTRCHWDFGAFCCLAILGAVTGECSKGFMQSNYPPKTFPVYIYIYIHIHS